MAANLKHAATESFLRARLAADEKEITYQKERADSQEKLVDTLASRLDVEERRMARFIMRVNELEQKVNGNTTHPSQMDQGSPRVLPPPAQSATANIKVSTESSKLPTVVKLAHSEISPNAAKALESKHMPLDESSKEVPHSNASHVDDNVIPEAKTLTAVDTEGLEKADDEDIGNDDVSEAFEKEVMSEDNAAVNASSVNNVGKTAVVRLAHKVIPAVSSSEEPRPSASISSAPKAVTVVPADSLEPSKSVSVPPPPPPPPAPADIDEVHDTADDEGDDTPVIKRPSVDSTRASASPPPGVLGAPPVAPPTAKVPPPPAAQVEDADIGTDSESEAADSEDMDATDSDEAADDELKKDDEALASEGNDNGDLDKADEEISSEEHELDSEEAAVAEDERNSTPSESEEADEEAV